MEKSSSKERMESETETKEYSIETAIILYIAFRMACVLCTLCIVCNCVYCFESLYFVAEVDSIVICNRQAHG